MKALLWLAVMAILAVGMGQICAKSGGMPEFTPLDTPQPGSSLPDLWQRATLSEQEEIGTALAVQATSAAQATRSVDEELARQAAGTAQAAQGTADAWSRQATRSAGEELEARQRAAEAAAAEERLRLQQITAAAAEREAEHRRAMEATEQSRLWIIAGWTATADSANSTATAQALATANQRAVEAQETASVETETIANLTATIQAGEVAAALRIQNAKAEKAELEAERERQWNWARGAWPWAALTVSLAGLGFALYKLVNAEAFRKRVVESGVPGDKPVVAIEKGNKTILIDQDKATGPAVVVDRNGNVSIPELSSAADQRAVTGRDQLVDHNTRGMPGARKTEIQPAQIALPAQAPRTVRIEVVDPGTLRPVLDEVETKLLKESV